MYIDKNQFKSIILKILILRFAPSLRKKKTKFGSVIFVILLHTFKVYWLLISVAMCKKAIGGPKIGSNLVKNSPIFSKVYFSKFALCSTKI